MKGHSAQFLHSEGDGGSVAEPYGRLYTSVPGPAGSSTWQPSSASQQPSVNAGPFPGASQTPWGEAVGQFGKQTIPRLTCNLPSALPKVLPVTVTSPWQPSNTLQQRRVAADLSPQASQMSWGVAVGQFGQPLSSFNSSAASFPPEVLPATVRPADGARPSEEVQRYATMLARDKSDPTRFRILGISFDTPAAVEGGLSNVGAWHLDSSSAQQESELGASSWDYNPEGCL
ncbi:hypothetical protein HPB49_015034 [Dermacentor silvarum]|uniref:Uncharacterized protein n=1 Tax=Dermacentor silvarum TaxID=543639 RepID=A0ACB8DPX0_DERSI|nr:hypothetical protein HPB49_015034 [Dermacentor silvarum]